MLLAALSAVLILATAAAYPAKAGGASNKSTSGPAKDDADRSGCAAEQHQANSLAAANDPAGFLRLGRLLYFGLCVPADYEKARQYLGRAEALGLICAPVLLESGREPPLVTGELERQALFRRCAFQLTMTEDPKVAISSVAELLSPAVPPPELTREIAQVFETIESSPQGTFALARRYISSENAPAMRQAARHWLRKLAVKPSSVQTESQHLLGQLVFEPDGSPFREEGMNRTFLLMAASAGHAPAQRDLGRYYTSCARDKTDRVRGYAWLLVAGRNGLEVGKLLKTAERHLDAADIADAEAISKTLPIVGRP